MATVLAATFEDLPALEKVREALLESGCAASDLCVFHINPQGQHDAFPIGGDQSADAGANEAAAGAAAGAMTLSAVLGAAGSAVGPAGTVMGAAIGAYAGALGGALSKMSHDAPLRKSGVLLAVHLQPEGTTANLGRQAIAALLDAQGAISLEQAEGRWENGEWADFDPVIPPKPYVRT